MKKFILTTIIGLASMHAFAENKQPELKTGVSSSYLVPFSTQENPLYSVSIKGNSAKFIYEKLDLQAVTIENSNNSFFNQKASEFVTCYELIKTKTIKKTGETKEVSRSYGCDFMMDKKGQSTPPGVG